MVHSLNIIWNPSEGIDLGFYVVRYYSLMWVVAFGLGFYVMKKIFVREEESIEKLDALFFYTIIATMIGARLGHVIFYDPQLFKDDFWSVFLPIRTNPKLEFTGFSGLASHGAAIGIIIAMIYYSRKIIKKHILWVLDRVVIPITLGGIFIRIGNFMNSEILGDVTTSSFGIKFVQDAYNKYEVTRITGISDYRKAYKTLCSDPQYSSYIENITTKHPTQLYEALGYVLVFIFLYFLYWKTNARYKQGFIFGVFLIVLWTVRFLAEFIKESQHGFEGKNPIFSTGQWLSIPFILLGIFIVYRSRRVASV